VEIFITGSRIPTRDLTSNSPLMTVGQEQIQQTGTTQIESLLNTLPQFSPSLTMSSNNPSSGGFFGGGSGQAQVDLRALTPTRTLVLIDGARVVPSQANNVVDINNIPAALVDRVEIITGGASAVYGSDAIAGVVNFILKKDFQGAEASFQYGLSDKGDGRDVAMNGLIGGNFADGKGNIVVNVGYDQRNGIFQGARQFSAFSRAVGTDYDFSLGSGTPPDGRYDVNLANQPTQAALNTLITAYGLPALAFTPNRSYGFNSNNTLWNAANAANFIPALNDPNTVRAAAFPPGGSVTYNYGPINDLILPFERWNIFGKGTYSVWEDYVKLFTQFLFTQTIADVQLAGTPATGLTVPTTNPYIPADLAALLDSRSGPCPANVFATLTAAQKAACPGGAATVNTTLNPANGIAYRLQNFTFRKRFTENGARIDSTVASTFQITAGLEGTFPGTWGHSWNWEMWYSDGRVNTGETQYGNIQFSKVQQLLTSTAVQVQAACGSAGDSFDVFGAGGVTPGCANFISATTHNITASERQDLEANLAGNILELPAGPLGFALGFETRRDNFRLSTDAILASGDVIGFNAVSPLSAGFDVREYYGETKIPILSEKQNIPWVYALNLEAGYRTSVYETTAGRVNTWKYGGDFSPLPMLKFRALAQQATRAPNIFELFSPQQQNFPGYADPCNFNSGFRTGPDAAAVATLCTQQGIPAGALATFFQTNSQAEAVAGGNPLLKPETAQTWTVGAVFAPKDALNEWAGRWLDSLVLTVDYYNIRVKGAIGVLAPSVVIGNCFNANNANQAFDPANQFCTLFNRSAGGEVQNVQLTNQNLALLMVRGLDTTINYTLGLDRFGADSWGSINFYLATTYQDANGNRPFAGVGFQNFVGTIGPVIGSATPKWKAVLNTTWDVNTPWGELSIAHRLQYIQSMAAFDTTGGEGLGTPTILYHNLFASLNPFEHVQIFAGVNNLLDRQPPVYTGIYGAQAGIQANTDPSTFDVIGRYFFGGVKLRY
jgi:outer membrane receptor protein involved in Fe transport